MSKKNNMAYLAAMAYAFITGLSFLFTKVSLNTAKPWDILSHRFTAAYMGLLIAVIFQWVRVDFNKERIKKLIPLALLYPLSFFAFQTTGLQYATSSEAAILLASSPIFTMILSSSFLKEKNTILQKISIIITVSGVIYITLMKGAEFKLNNILGIILLLLSSLSISGYSVWARHLTKDFTSIEISYIMITISFIVYNIIAIIRHMINGTISTFFLPFTNITYLISILYLGILSSLGTLLLTNYILSKMEASRMSVFSNLGTVISIVAGVVFLNENIFYFHIIGSILIIGGVIGTNYFKKEDDMVEDKSIG